MPGSVKHEYGRPELDQHGRAPSGRLHAYHEAVYDVAWTTEERAALDTGMTRCAEPLDGRLSAGFSRVHTCACCRFPADRFHGLERYVRIAALLPRKGARDVALRIRWLLVRPASCRNACCRWRACAPCVQVCLGQQSLTHMLPACDVRAVAELCAQLCVTARSL